MPNIKQNLDSITVVGFTICDESVTKRSVRQLEQDQKVPLSYIGKVGVGIPVHNGGHVLGECVGNASSDGMKLK